MTIDDVARFRRMRGIAQRLKSVDKIG